jgi:hypothetical protein
MTTELFRDDGDRDERDPDFDPVAEGARHQLGAEVSLAIWDYVARQLTGYGSRDPLLIRQCFQEVAARVAARGGRLAPDIGRTTRVDLELGPAAPAVPIEAPRRRATRPRAPGRTTLVLVEDDRSISRDNAVVRPARSGARRRRSTPPMSGAGSEWIAHDVAREARHRASGHAGGPRVSRPGDADAQDAEVFAARFVTRLFSVPRTEARPREAAREPPTSPRLPDSKWEQLFGGASIAVDKPGRVSAPLGILLKVKAAPHAAKVSQLIPFDDPVHVARTSAGERGTVRWAYVVATKAGVSGFIEERFLATDPPEPTAMLHRRKPGETVGRIADPAQGTRDSAGAEAAMSMQGLHEANRDRPGIAIDEVQRSMFDRASGAAPDHDFTAGVLIGVLEGLYEAIRDLLQGARERIRLAFDVVRAQIAGHLLQLIKRGAEGIKDLFEKLSATALLEAVGPDIASRWSNARWFGKGELIGEVVGYIAANVVLATLIEGSTLATRLSEAAEVGGGVSRAVMTLIKLTDAAQNPLDLFATAGPSVEISEGAAAKLKRALAQSGSAVHDAEHAATRAEPAAQKPRWPE